MAKFITSDYHLGEERLEIMGRPFKSTEEMENELIRLHNEIVSSDDEVIIVGDLCRQGSGHLEKIAKFNGKKTLIRGNHDKQFSDEELKEYFDTVIPDGDGIEITVENIPCYITHYPTRGRVDKFNLVGHIHAAWKYQLNSFNVGVDANHFRPVNLNTIPFHFRAVCQFYDDDVWAAYNEINAYWRGKRGKEGTYFNE